MPAQSKAQQRFMGMVHATQKGDMDNPSKEVQKAADSMSDKDAKDYASTKHAGLPNNVKKENMENKLKEIIRQTYRESLRESVQMNEISSIDGLNDVVKGQTTQIEGIKLSKEMAEHIISWMNTSPYGRKYNSWVKKNSISKILPITFNWGLERGLPSNLKSEFVALKAKYSKKKDESVNETISHEAMGIASMTNTRKEAVQKFIDDNDLNALEILKIVTKGGLYERVRFIQALVGTPNNSSFKWYVRTYANESVNEVKVIDIVDRFENLKLPNIVYLNKKPFTGKTFVMNGYNGYKSSDTDGLFYDINTKKPLTDKQGNILRATTHRGAKFDFKDGIRESVNEGKKVFKVNPPIGKAKYSISSHNGTSTHNDGSDFYDIKIFKSKVDLEKGIKDYKSKGFVEEGIENNVNEGPFTNVLKMADKNFERQEAIKEKWLSIDKSKMANEIEKLDKKDQNTIENLFKAVKPTDMNTLIPVCKFILSTPAAFSNDILSACRNIVNQK